MRLPRLLVRPAFGPAALCLTLCLTLGVLALAAAPASAMEVEKVTGKSGVTAWLVQDSTIPVISVAFAFRGGSASDPAGQEGLATLVSGLLDEGAGKLDSQTFQGRLQNLAISLGFDAGRDSFLGHMKTLAANRDAAFDLLRLALTEPRFDERPLERVRAQLLSNLAEAGEDPNYIANRAFLNQLYPHHPYGRPVLGTPETVKALTAAECRDFVKNRFARDNLLVAVVGDITPDQLRPLLDSTFGALPAKAQPIDVAQAAPDLSGKITVVNKDIPQSVVAFGQQGLARKDPRWYAAMVMNYILGGGGFASRLTDEVREKRGLAYGVYSELEPFDHSALIVGGVGTRNAKVGESIAIIRQQWRLMETKGPTAKEVADAKRYLTGSWPLRMNSTMGIAGTLLAIRLERLGIGYINDHNRLIDAVTLPQVQDVAKELLKPAALTFVVVGRPVIDGAKAP